MQLNGQLLALAEGLARPVGLTATRWQVLGAVLRQPLTVAGIAPAMGHHPAERAAHGRPAGGRRPGQYLPNAAHRRAKLVQVTAAGLDAVRAITPAHRAAGEHLVAVIGAQELERAVEALRALSAALDQGRQPRATTLHGRAEITLAHLAR